MHGSAGGEVLMKIFNAKTQPAIYYGLHMAPGVAEYREKDKDPYRIMIDEACLKLMDRTFPGCPVYVNHVDKVDLDKIQLEADGYVVESFYNPVDGKHWAKFVVVSDRGHEAIRGGWSLSNAYIPDASTMRGAGQWHGVDYSKEVMNARYEHLAIVRNPRYDESVIMTPDQFKEYNDRKERELEVLKNSKTEEKGMLNIFKKTKVENSSEFDSMVVELPKSKKQIQLSKLVNDMDDMEVSQMANGEHCVMVGEDKMKLNDLVEKYADCKNKLADFEKKNATVPADDEAKKKAEAEAMAKQNSEKEAEEAAKKANSEKAEAEAAAKKAEEEKMKNENMAKLQNAADIASKAKHNATVDLSEDKVARGKSRYGSN